MTPRFVTCADLARDLAALGLARGDMVMVHAAMSRVGPLLHGPDALIDALLAVVGQTGTVVAYTDWDGAYHGLLDESGRLPEAWRAHVPPFDPFRSRAIRDNGVLAEFLRTTPGALRSANPGASVAALGARADWVTADHPLDYGYGEGSPFARIVEAGGKVLLVGAPHDTMTLLHHAEHLACVPGKRVLRFDVPLRTENGTLWRHCEEFDTSRPVVDGFPEDYFARIVADFLEGGEGRLGNVGDAPSLLVDAAAICAFAVSWIEAHARDCGDAGSARPGVAAPRTGAE